MESFRGLSFFGVCGLESELCPLERCRTVYFGRSVKDCERLRLRMGECSVRWGGTYRDWFLTKTSRLHWTDPEGG